MSTFSDPAAASGGSMPLPDLLGHTVLVKPVSYETGISTVHGEKDAIKVNVVDLNTGTHELGVLWFPGYVVGSLKTQIGQYVLATVIQGDDTSKGNRPWLLQGASGDPAAVAAAEQWLAANPGVLDGTPITNPNPVAATAAPAVPPLGATPAPAVPPLPQAAPQLA